MRVGVVGLGVIGKRVAHVLRSAPHLSLVGVAVRSVPAAFHALPTLAYYAADSRCEANLREAGAHVAGHFPDLLRQVDAIVDSGTAGTGIQRFEHYRQAQVRALFCGGERNGSLGPLIHPALNLEAVQAAASVRLLSCNTTAMGRMIAALGVSSIGRLDAIVLRCCTDNDKARKGRTNGASFGPGESHHATDIRAIVPSLAISSVAATLPMTCGHVIQLRVETPLPLDEVRRRLDSEPRISLVELEGVVDTANLRAQAARRGRPWSERYDLVVQLAGYESGPGGSGVLRCWLSLDNESITVPEIVDALAVWSGQATAEVGETSNRLLGIGPFRPDAVQRQARHWVSP